MTAEQRSETMSKIQGTDTGPEMKLRRELWHRGFRYRVHHDIDGSPDLAFLGARVAVFVDGCFWHGCPEHSNLPKSNRDFWRQKLERNRERDREVDERLEEEGWQVVRLWEHEVEDDVEAAADRVAQIVKAGSD